MKVCTKCGEIKPLSDYFKRKASKDGLDLWCKPCNMANNKEWVKKNPHKIRQNTKKWTAKNPKKLWAHWTVGNAIRYGKLTPQKCHVCGAEKADAHHEDYDKPLDITWLCRKHHKEKHREAVA